MDDIMRTQFMPALERELASHGLLTGGKTVLVGASGGADSTALLHVLALLRDTHDFSLAAVHVEHGLRAEASRADASFVKALCDKLGVPLHQYSVDAVQAQKTLRCGAEEAARILRYDCFRKAMKETGAAALLLAHHGDDQAETVLMHLLRGSGPAGLAGMAACSPFEGGLLLRPLLAFSHQTLCDALSKAGQPWREDETNREPGSLRNALRLNILPQMEKLVPGGTSAMGRAAALMAGEEGWWNEEATAWLQSHARLKNDLAWLDRAALQGKHPAYQRRILRFFFEEASKRMGILPDRGMTALSCESTEEFRNCLIGGGGKAVNLPQNVRAERSDTRLFLLSGRKAPPMPPVSLSLPGETFFGEYRLTAKPWQPGMDLGDGIVTQALDLDELKGAAIRTRLPGDMFQLLGSLGTQPFKETLIDRRVDRPFRDGIPLIVRGGDILWIPGLFASGTAAIRPQTKQGMLFTIFGELPWRRDSK
jgi:tRNA(Ile)-lysidine synthase